MAVYTTTRVVQWPANSVKLSVLVILLSREWGSVAQLTHYGFVLVVFPRRLFPDTRRM